MFLVITAAAIGPSFHDPTIKRTTADARTPYRQTLPNDLELLIWGVNQFTSITLRIINNVIVIQTVVYL